MQLFFGSDHGGFQLKEFLKAELGKKLETKDFGCFSEESCDYPDFAERVAKAVAESNGKALGILCCGTGIGMSIAANKVSGIRAAVVWNEFSARMAREHNNANVICFGGRILEKEEALKLAEIFLEAEFAGLKEDGARHAKRVEKIMEIEKRQL